MMLLVVAVLVVAGRDSTGKVSTTNESSATTQVGAPDQVATGPGDPTPTTGPATDGAASAPTVGQPEKQGAPNSVQPDASVKAAEIAPAVKPTPAARPEFAAPSSAANAEEACKVISIDAMKAAVGELMVPAGSDNTGGCVFTAAADHKRAVSVRKTTGPESKDNYAKIKAMFGPNQVNDLKLGDSSFVGAGQAYVLQAKTLVSVTVAMDKPVADLDGIAGAVAKAIVNG